MLDRFLLIWKGEDPSGLIGTGTPGPVLGKPPYLSSLARNIPARCLSLSNRSSSFILSFRPAICQISCS